MAAQSTPVRLTFEELAQVSGGQGAEGAQRPTDGQPDLGLPARDPANIVFQSGWFNVTMRSLSLLNKTPQKANLCG